MRSVFLAPTFFLASSWLAMQAYSAPVESAVPPSIVATTANSAPQPVPVNPVAFRAHVNKSGHQSPLQLTPVQPKSKEDFAAFQLFATCRGTQADETCYRTKFEYCYKTTEFVEERHCCWQEAEKFCDCKGKNPYNCPMIGYKPPSEWLEEGSSHRKSTE